MTYRHVPFQVSVNRPNFLEITPYIGGGKLCNFHLGHRAINILGDWNSAFTLGVWKHRWWRCHSN